MELTVHEVLDMLKLAYPESTDILNKLDAEITDEVIDRKWELEGEIAELQDRNNYLEEKSLEDNETIERQYNELVELRYGNTEHDCSDYGGCDKCRGKVIANLPPEEVSGGCMADFDACEHSSGGAVECTECRKDECNCNECPPKHISKEEEGWPERYYSEQDDECPF